MIGSKYELPGKLHEKTHAKLAQAIRKPVYGPPDTPKTEIEKAKKRAPLSAKFFLLATFFALLSYPRPAVAIR